MKTKYILASVVLTFGLSSCVVSKKKYDTLTLAKQASDRKVRSLLKEKRQLEEDVASRENTIGTLEGKLRSLKEEFNNLKYDMSASNAQKSSEIDKLSKKLNNTLKNAKSEQEKSKELEGDLSWLRKVRQQNEEKITSLEAQIKSLENEVKTLQSANEAATNSKASSQQKIEDLTSKVNALEELLKRERATNTRLQEELKGSTGQAQTTEKQTEAVPEI